MKYSNKLRELRKITNIKATDLANLLDVTFQHYYALERGDRQLSATQLKKLSNSLGVSIDQIVDTQTLVNEQKKSIGHLIPNGLSTQENFNAQEYFRITEEARKNGISPEDFEVALDIVKRFKNKEK